MPQFVATDGTVFTTRKAYRQYEFKTQYTFQKRSGERLAKEPGSIAGQPFDVADLAECQVVLADHTDQIQIDDCVSCRIFIGACSESVFVRNCKDCTFHVAAKQLRLRDCSLCTFSLYSQTEPVIETSSEITFSPFAGGYLQQRDDMASARLDPEANFWWGVFDFNDEMKTGKNFVVNEEPMEPWWPLGECEQKDAQRAVEEHSNVSAPPPTEPPQNEIDASWEPVCIGICYSPLLLGLQYRERSSTELLRVDMLLGDIAVDDDATTIIDRLADQYHDYLDFKTKLSKKQVVRLVEMLLTRHRCGNFAASKHAARMYGKFAMEGDGRIKA
ncbi:hypothetical protein CTAYLR_004813 [Chrysophaeum taylorii]|uniref:C-CAP/cofactor C-like domain-containing protein n=1 Tax=Chrysophaeum taylorii TaxID=2483200 RepID=A0AAD7UMT2_9STRA|nr:hypothetical protein CTAYLR_004813 [Chrysophaeum taylorii]